MSVLLRGGVLQCLWCSSVSHVTLKLQPIRHTSTFRRMFPPPLYKKHQKGPFRPRLEKENYTYIEEDNLHKRPQGDMEVILATDVEGLGFEGDIISISKRLARNHMLPVGVAEYVTEENLQKYEPVRKKREHEIRQSLTAHKTMKQLQHMNLPVPMSASVPWTLNKTHVKVAFRMCGVELSEDEIELPEEPVNEPKQIRVYVTVNKLDKVPVNVIIYTYSKTSMPTLPPIWSKAPEVKFNIFDAIAAAACRMRGLTYTPPTAD